MKLDFLIIGAQKSASTFIHHCLREHPSLFMPKGETPIFLDPAYHKNGINKLEKILQQAPKGKLIGIKRPDYLTRVECPERIHKYAPNSKLIVVLRNPVYRAVSAYFHMMRHGLLPIISLEEGMKNIINGQQKVSYPKSQQIIEYGYYYKYILHYLKFFKKENILIIIDDDLKKEPEKTIVRVYKFLGVDTSYTPRSISSKANKGIYSLKRLKFISNGFKLIFNYDRKNGRMYLKKKFYVPFAKAFIYSIDSLILAPIYKNNKPLLSNELKYQLLDIYRDDITKLESILNIDLSLWKQNLNY